MILDAARFYFSGDFANASSIHSPGQRARAAVETAREQVAALIGARPQEIVFTSGGTESDNHGIFGSVAQVPLPVRLSSTPHPRLPTNHHYTIEHEAVLNACQSLEKAKERTSHICQSIAEAKSIQRPSASRLSPETVLITVMQKPTMS